MNCLPSILVSAIIPHTPRRNMIFGIMFRAGLFVHQQLYSRCRKHGFWGFYAKGLTFSNNFVTILLNGPPYYSSRSLEMSNNPALLFVDLTSVRKLGSRASQVFNNINLKDNYLSNLEALSTKFTLSGNPSLLSLDFPLLTTYDSTYSHLQIPENANLKSTNFSSLRTLSGNLTLSNNDNLVEINLRLSGISSLGGLSIKGNLILEKSRVFCAWAF